MKPLFAVLGSAQLPGVLVDAGFDVLTDQTSPLAVLTAAADPSLEAPVILLAVNPDQALSESLSSFVRPRRHLAVLGHSETPIRAAREISLPCTVGDVMSLFKAPSNGSEQWDFTIAEDGSMPDLGGVQEPPEEAFSEADEPSFENDVETVSPSFFAPSPEPEPAPVPYAAPAAEPEPVPVPARSADAAVTFDEPIDVSRLVGRSSATSMARGTGLLCPVVVVFAAKGGVGKTTFALSLAQRAVETGGVAKVVLIDGNRGQGDVRNLVRLGSSSLPTIYDAALSGRPGQAIVGPKYLALERPSTLPNLGFGLVMAPRDGQTDPRVVTQHVYADALEEARRNADLVIIDTQILEDSDTTGLWDGVWLPLLLSGGWGVGLSDGSLSGVLNLLSRLRGFRTRGMRPDRIVLGLNRMDPESQLDLAQARQHFESFGTFAGVTHQSAQISTAFETGRIPMEAPELALMLDTILYRITGLAKLDPQRPGGPGAVQGPAAKRGLFGALFGRRN